MVNKSRGIKVFVYCAGIAVVLGAASVIFVPDARVAVLRDLFPDVCLSENQMTIPNLSGMKFEVIYTNCDTLAKEEEISVYVSGADVNGESVLAKWSNRRTVLFRYDPWSNDTPLPSIQAAGNDRILISVPRVSSVDLQTRKWRNVTIDYNIGDIEYPQGGALTPD
jgi:hypothetical protein